MPRLTPWTAGPVSYRLMYGEANPWVRWLASVEDGGFSKRLLKLAPVDFWFPPSVFEIDRRIEDVRQVARDLR